VEGKRLKLLDILKFSTHESARPKESERKHLSRISPQSSERTSVAASERVRRLRVKPPRGLKKDKKRDLSLENRASDSEKYRKGNAKSDRRS